MQKILSAALLGLLSAITSGNAVAESAALLVYKVWEEGVDPYLTRILITEDHVRLDEGADQGDFTLFDRRQEIIYNVAMQDQSVLVIAPQLVEVPANPGLLLSEKDQVDEQAPKIAGVAPHNIELLANNEVCGQLVVVPGLMGDALEGLHEFKQVLARVQAATLAGRPEELQTPCDLASNIHAATRTVDFGLPIQERSEGRAQVLVDFAEEHEVDAGLFVIPEGFGRHSMPSLPAL